VAVVVARPEVAVDEAAIKAFVMVRVDQGVISKYAVPERVVFAESIAKTSVGKLDKKVLRGQYS
jgi:fatty-acyl-CoA synthase